MTTPTIDEAIDALRRLAPERQRDLAGYILSLAAEDGAPGSIDAEHLPYVTEGLEQARRRQFATDQEVEAAYRSFEE